MTKELHHDWVADYTNVAERLEAGVAHSGADRVSQWAEKVLIQIDDVIERGFVSAETMQVVRDRVEKLIIKS